MNQKIENNPLFSMVYIKHSALWGWKGFKFAACAPCDYLMVIYYWPAHIGNMIVDEGFTRVLSITIKAGDCSPGAANDRAHARGTPPPLYAPRPRYPPCMPPAPRPPLYAPGPATPSVCPRDPLCLPPATPLNPPPSVWTSALFNMDDALVLV